MMTEQTPGTDLAVVDGHGNALALDAEQPYWNEAQLAVLRQIGADQAPEADLQVFHHVCQRTGLDPFARQIHIVGRMSKEWDPQSRTEQRVKKFTIQTGIDGYRLIARRAADRAGVTLEYEDTEWCGPDGEWVTVWTKATAPTAARVTVLRDGHPFPAVAVYREYVQTKSNGEPNSMWSRMPGNQLAKCAEAAALRKAFPQDLSGVYADEEMGQADTQTVHGEVIHDDAPRRGRRRRPGLAAQVNQTSDPEPEPAVAPPGNSGSEPLFLVLDGSNPEHTALVTRIEALFDELQASETVRAQYVTDVAGDAITGPGDLTVENAEAIITALEHDLEQPFGDGEAKP